MKEVIKTVNAYQVALEDVDDDYIYAFKGITSIFKAHRVSEDAFAFVSLADSKCYGNGVYASLEKLIGHALTYGNRVFEFKDCAEFVEWLNDEV